MADRKAVDLSMKLYAQGQTDFLNVLDAQRSLYAAEDALVQSTRSTATDLIAVYKAVGGGWESEPLATQSRNTSAVDSRQARKCNCRTIEDG